MGIRLIHGGDGVALDSHDPRGDATHTRMHVSSRTPALEYDYADIATFSESSSSHPAVNRRKEHTE